MIFVLVPVHNRLRHVEPFVHDLVAQGSPPPFRLVIIDAGSTDGTSDFIASVSTAAGGAQISVEYIDGRTDWWWSRSITEGIDRILPELAPDDKVLIINDDVSLTPDYLRNIAAFSDEHPRSLITSCLRAKDDPLGPPFHYGVAIDEEHLTFVDVVPTPLDSDVLIHSDVASGRGTIFPAAAIIAGVRPRTRRLPHYLADYDMGVQARALGYTIIGRSDIYVTTERIQGNSKRFKNQFQYRTKTESPGRLLNWWNFWTSRKLGIGRAAVIRRAVGHAVSSGS